MPFRIVIPGRALPGVSVPAFAATTLELSHALDNRCRSGSATVHLDAIKILLAPLKRESQQEG
jgi:hypothetical protein